MRKRSEDAINAPFRREKSRQEDFVACDKPGCSNKGEYRAPKRGAAGRGQTPGAYWQYCLEHVTEYNRAWNYFEGMSAAQMEAQRRADILWQRPTYKMGGRDNQEKNPYAKGEPKFGDPFGFWNQRFGHQRDEDKGAFSSGMSSLLSAQQRDALAIMGLDAPISAMDVKKRYRMLAKKLHPDLNPDNAQAEEQLKRVNKAYSILKDGIEEPA